MTETLEFDVDLFIDNMHAYLAEDYPDITREIQV